MTSSQAAASPAFTSRPARPNQAVVLVLLAVQALTCMAIAVCAIG